MFDPSSTRSVEDQSSYKQANLHVVADQDRRLMDILQAAVLLDRNQQPSCAPILPSKRFTANNLGVPDAWTPHTSAKTSHSHSSELQPAAHSSPAPPSASFLAMDTSSQPMSTLSSNSRLRARHSVDGGPCTQPVSNPFNVHSASTSHLDRLVDAMSNATPPAGQPQQPLQQFFGALGQEPGMDMPHWAAIAAMAAAMQVPPFHQQRHLLPNAMAAAATSAAWGASNSNMPPWCNPPPLPYMSQNQPNAMLAVLMATAAQEQQQQKQHELLQHHHQQQLLQQLRQQNLGMGIGQPCSPQQEVELQAASAAALAQLPPHVLQMLASGMVPPAQLIPPPMMWPSSAMQAAMEHVILAQMLGGAAVSGSTGSWSNSGNGLGAFGSTGSHLPSSTALVSSLQPPALAALQAEGVNALMRQVGNGGAMLPPQSRSYNPALDPAVIAQMLAPMPTSTKTVLSPAPAPTMATTMLSPSVPHRANKGTAATSMRHKRAASLLNTADQHQQQDSSEEEQQRASQPSRQQTPRGRAMSPQQHSNQSQSSNQSFHSHQLITRANAATATAMAPPATLEGPQQVDGSARNDGPTPSSSELVSQLKRMTDEPAPQGLPKHKRQRQQALMSDVEVGTCSVIASVQQHSAPCSTTRPSPATMADVSERMYRSPRNASMTAGQ